MEWKVELETEGRDEEGGATKEERREFWRRKGGPREVVENLQSMEDEEDIYESIEEIWPDFPTEEDYLWNEDEY